MTVKPVARGAVVVPLRPSKKTVTRKIRGAAKNRDKPLVFISVHARTRMAQRHVDESQVYKCLRRGKLDRGPEWSEEHKDWECGIAWFTAGDVIDVRVSIESFQEDSPIYVTTVIRK